MLDVVARHSSQETSQRDKAGFEIDSSLMQWLGHAIMPKVFDMQPVQRRKRFNEIYRTNEWNSEETRSGRGSEWASTEHVRRIVDVALIFTKARSLLDAGCGEANWLNGIRLPLDHIIGVDIVDDPTLRRHWHNRMHGRARNLTYLNADLTIDQLPAVDIVVCRDVLVHLSNNDCLAALRNIQASGSRYLLATSFDLANNSDIETGLWRMQNLENPPFCLSPPVRRWNEDCPLDGGRYRDKCLNLWHLPSLKLEL